MEQFDSRYFRGQGKVFIGDRDAAGQPAGLVFVGNVSTASLTGNIDRSSKIESVTGAGAVGASFIKGSKYAVSLALSSIKAAHLKEAIHGVVITKIGASVTDEAHIGYLDKFIRLLHTNVSAVVVTDSSGTTTYTKDTDYIEDLVAGTIEILSTGTVTEAQALLVDYSYAAQTHITVLPNNTEKYVMFDGINTADNNKKVRCEMFKTKFSPGSLDLITDDSKDVTLEGEIELDSLRPAGDQFYSWITED